MRILHFLGPILLLLGSPAMAKGGESAMWVVTQKSGQVQLFRSGMQPASVQVRAALAPGDMLATGANGRAMLTRGGDYVVIAPGSRLILPKNEQPSGVTQLIQQIGTMLYKVRHTGVPHFTVETPMLAAVVKGTSFTVIVDEKRSAVQVTDGLVEVSTAGGNVRRLVEHGRTVIVVRERPQEIIELKAGATELPTAAAGEGVKIDGSGDVALSTIADLTGGLVSAAPAKPTLLVTTAPTVKASAGGAITGAVVTAATADLAPAVAPPNLSALTPPVANVIVTPISTVAAPALTTPTLATPTLTTPTLATPTVTVPTVTVPTVAVPTVTVPTVTVPTVTVPTVTVPTVTVPTVTVPIVTVPIVTVPIVTVPTVTVPTVTVPIIVVPLVPGP